MNHPTSIFRFHKCFGAPPLGDQSTPPNQWTEVFVERSRTKLQLPAASQFPRPGFGDIFALIGEFHCTSECADGFAVFKIDNPPLSGITRDVTPAFAQHQRAQGLTVNASSSRDKRKPWGADLQSGGKRTHVGIADQ